MKASAELMSSAPWFAAFQQIQHGLEEASSSAGVQTTMMTVEIAMRRLQEAYDCCTRTTSSIRSSSRDLLSLVASNSIAAASTKMAVVKARALEPYVGTLENLLFTEAKMVSIAQVKEVPKYNVISISLCVYQRLDFMGYVATNDIRSNTQAVQGSLVIEDSRSHMAQTRP